MCWTGGEVVVTMARSSARCLSRRMPANVSATAACFIEHGDSKPAAWWAFATDARRRVSVEAFMVAADSARYRATVSALAGNEIRACLVHQAVKSSQSLRYARRVFGERAIFM